MSRSKDTFVLPKTKRPDNIMFDKLKQLAQQKLVEKMASNALGQSDTEAAAQEGAAAWIGNIKESLTSGGAEQVSALFSGGAAEGNGIFDSLKGNLVKSLISRGFSQSDAEAEATNVAPGIVDSIKEKFASNAAEDSDFDLGAIAGLVGGGNIADKAKDLLGGGGSDLLDKAKKLF